MTRKETIVLLAVILTVFGGVLAFAQQGKVSPTTGYKIGPKDLLEITVFDLPELNQVVRVTEDGAITLPLVGRVVIEGLNIEEVEKKLAGLLEEKWLKKARVSVFIKEYQSNRVSVIGAVGKPGMYELIGKATLLQMISLAGGLTSEASRELYVWREGKNGKQDNIAINLEDLIINNHQELNIAILPNDVINIPMDPLIQIYVFGAVKTPGALEVKLSKKITLLQAIAQAGGPSEGASNSVVIKRKDKKTGKEKKINVNLKDIIKGKKPDIELQEGDIVYVPESIF